MAVIAAALESIHADYGGWQAVMASGRSSNATPLSAAALGAASEEFLDNSWRSFLTVVDHAQPLMVRCRPASSPWPTDAETLSRLADGVLRRAPGAGPLPCTPRPPRRTCPPRLAGTPARHR
ncbi:hypothetical protein SMICM304S_12033 [Streptomyces microflavus]